MTYLLGNGLGLDIGVLSPIVPQPACPLGVQVAQRDMGADGSIHESGLFCVLEWRAVGSAVRLQTLLEQFDLESNLWSFVTVTLPDFERLEHVYNARAIRPRVTTYASFVRGLSLLLRDLVQIA